jgi:hypothetical protein
LPRRPVNYAGEMMLMPPSPFGDASDLAARYRFAPAFPG